MKKIKKFHTKLVCTLGLAVAFFATSLPCFDMQITAAQPTSAAATLAEGIGSKDAPQRPTVIGLEITGQVPYAQTGSDRLNEELNERFTAQRNAFEQDHLTSALSIHFDDARYTSGNFASVVFTKEATSASITSAISTTVIDARTNRVVTLSDYNVNITQVINGYINNKISANPRGFVTNFTGIDANHPFYLDDDHLVIPFGSSELVPDERNVHYVQLSISNIQDETIGSSFFETLPPSQYNTIMVRLTEVVSRFGYEYEWIGETRTVNIMIDGDIVSYVTLDENSYHYRDRTPRELELAPMAFNDRAYVPLSFFSELMGIPATVTTSGIVMTRYHFAAASSESLINWYDLE
ncbi:MAG: copper amine oxidase N-terminal domain-containing protein [Defluviitaleaceae bacterium]|nr:copper amine oxidase N-terminal domain-containing protein [Defluviitaleaceae bacterium]